MPYSVGVRSLCEFGARTGSINFRSSPSPTASEGMAGHQAVVASRAAHYEPELALSLDYASQAESGFVLKVRGRADGFDSRLGRVEEIKTHSGPVEAINAGQRELHWAQARSYGHMICIERGLAEIGLAVVYYDVDTAEQTVLLETANAADLKAQFEALCERFAVWAIQEQKHRQDRDRGLAKMSFPHGAFRVGQRELARAVYNAHRRQCALLAQAPTGIGKSLATLFPALKAGASQRIDKIFFLTAKTSGREIGLAAWRQIRRANPAARLRVLEMTAREKACEHPDRLCHGDSCPLARGYYDRLPQARAQAAGAELLDRSSLREIGLAHQVCPYYLSQEMVRWSDLIIGDYNHYFDAGGWLAGLALAHEWSVSVLVDEVHNLVDRARSMYTVSVSCAEFAAGGHANAMIGRAANRIRTVLRGLDEPANKSYQVLHEVPRVLVDALQAYVLTVGEYLRMAPQTGRTPAGDLQMERYFTALRFCRMAETFAEHSVCDLSRADPALSSGQDGTGPSVCIRNVVPAPFLRPRIEAAHSMVLFSATVSPQQYLFDMIGLPDTSVFVDVPAPFSADQIDVRLVASVPTRWSRRRASIEPITQLIGDHVRQHPGNYLVYVSSFEYLRLLVKAFSGRYPDLRLVEQSRSMGERDRDAFIAGFQQDGHQIGFAVLGGAFAEGIDLPGEQLIGAFVVTLGLPRSDPVTEAIRKRCDELYGAGFEYAYLYPGIQRVVQAAGRVIRTPQDRGHVFLIDERIRKPAIRALLPAWWGGPSGRSDQSDANE